MLAVDSSPRYQNRHMKKDWYEIFINLFTHKKTGKYMPLKWKQNNHFKDAFDAKYGTKICDKQTKIYFNEIKTTKTHWIKLV